MNKDISSFDEDDSIENSKKENVFENSENMFKSSEKLERLLSMNDRKNSNTAEDLEIKELKKYSSSNIENKSQF